MYLGGIRDGLSGFVFNVVVCFSVYGQVSLSVQMQMVYLCGYIDVYRQKEV